MSSIDRFDVGLAEVRRLLELDPTETEASEDLPVDENHELQASGASVRRAAVVLLVSHFEGYLRRICEDLIDALDESDMRTKQIPLRVRELHIVPRLDAVVSAKSGSTERAALIGRLSTVSALWNEEAKPPRGTLKADIVTREVHNADSERIDELFAIFGERRKVCDGDIDVRTENGEGDDTHDIRIRLSDIVKCRNDIAHGDPERRPTMKDVRRYMSFLHAFAARLDRKASNLIKKFVASGDHHADEG